MGINIPIIYPLIKNKIVNDENLCVALWEMLCIIFFMSNYYEKCIIK